MKKTSDIRENRGAEGSATSTSRRRLLTALTAGGAAVVAAPAEWTKPALKSVVLPAHAQTSPAGGGCVISLAGAGVLNDGISMSITAQADADCGSTASVEVRDSDGSLLISCSNNTVPFGNGKVSWSCTGSTDLAGGSAGGLITFDVTFSNGCTCRAVDDA